MSKIPGEDTDELTWLACFLSDHVPEKSGSSMKITVPFQTPSKIGNGEGITP